MAGGEKEGKSITHLQPGLIAKMAGIRIGIRMRKVVFGNQGRRTALDQRPTDGMGMRVVFSADILERLFKKVTNHQALADMQVAERVEVQTPGLQQVFMWALGKCLPIMVVDARCEGDSGAPARHSSAGV